MKKTIEDKTTVKTVEVYKLYAYNSEFGVREFGLALTKDEAADRVVGEALRGKVSRAKHEAALRNALSHGMAWKKGKTGDTYFVLQVAYDADGNEIRLDMRKMEDWLKSQTARFGAWSAFPIAVGRGVAA